MPSFADTEIESNFPNPLPASATISPSRLRSPPRQQTDNRLSRPRPVHQHQPKQLNPLEQTNLAERLNNPMNFFSQYKGRRINAEQVAANERANGVQRQMSRRWVAGDVYSPHDLSPIEQVKWRRRQPGNRDVFDALNINPLHEWKNVSMLEEFRTPLGRIKHRNETGLRPVNQRRVSKAIRRAVAMGWLPSVHRHPEIVEHEEQKRNERRFGLDGRSGILRM